MTFSRRGGEGRVLAFTILTFELFSRLSYPERLTGAFRVKYLAQGYRQIFHQVSLGIRTSHLLFSGPTPLTSRLPAAPRHQAHHNQPAGPYSLGLIKDGYQTCGDTCSEWHYIFFLDTDAAWHCLLRTCQVAQLSFLLPHLSLWYSPNSARWHLILCDVEE